LWKFSAANTLHTCLLHVLEAKIANVSSSEIVKAFEFAKFSCFTVVLIVYVHTQMKNESAHTPGYVTPSYWLVSFYCLLVTSVICAEVTCRIGMLLSVAVDLVTLLA